MPRAGRLAGGATATVEINRTDAGLDVRVTPHRPRSACRPVDQRRGKIVIQVGEIGGRWDLGVETDDIMFLQDLTMSVVAGRVSEVFASRRSRVTVALGDGSTVTETGYDGADRLPTASAVAAMVTDSQVPPVSVMAL